jgi:6-pyruvoyltetrahydropterin/6-carboxytetrahydropterin synthase
MARYTVRVTTEFCAAHALMFRGVREPIHGHNFRVRVLIAGPALDADGVLCDFHEVEKALERVIAPWRNANLQDAAAFAGVNPSAEMIARVVGESLQQSLAAVLPPLTGVASVSVTEAPGCEATWEA